jgi:hypothetical protein
MPSPFRSLEGASRQKTRVVSITGSDKGPTDCNVFNMQRTIMGQSLHVFGAPLSSGQHGISSIAVDMTTSAFVFDWIDAEATKGTAARPAAIKTAKTRRMSRASFTQL